MASAPAATVSAAPAAAASAPTADRAAAPCTRCGYDLRGTDEGARCPECGLPAYWSLRAPQQLSQYPAAWVASMAWATRLLALAYGGMFVLLLAGFTGQFDGVRWGAPIGFFAGAMLQLGAAVLLARSSRHWSEPRATVNRLVLLTASVAAVVAGAIGIYMEAMRIPQPTFLVGALLATMCGWVVAPPAAFFRIRTVARMIADARLARHSTIAFRGLLATLLLMAGGIAVTMMFNFNPVENRPATVVLVLVCFLVLCFLLWGAFVMLRCVRDFGRAARVARRAEATAEPP